MLLCTIGALLLVTIFFVHKRSYVQAMEAKLLSEQMLPSVSVSDRPADPEIQKQYEEVLAVSKELNLEVQDWLNCLQAPEGVLVRLSSFDWTVSGQSLELHVVASSRDEAARYIEAWQKSTSLCVASVRQEERSPEGASLLSVKLRPSAEAGPL